MPDWLWWVLAALVLAGVEILTLDLLFLMLAGGALAGAVATALGLPLIGTAAVAGLVAVGLVAFVRPIALRHVQTPLAIRTGVEALRGAEAVVVERVDRHDGRIKLKGEVWSARSYDPDNVFEPGDHVNVMEIDGATALVG